MAKRKRRSFTAEFKAKVVLEALRGESSQAAPHRSHTIWFSFSFPFYNMGTDR